MLLEAERETERRFVTGAANDEPKGWSAALVMFHVARWRGRLRTAMENDREGRAYTLPPADIDALNDAELPRGTNVSLQDAAAEADSELAGLIELSHPDRPFDWGPAKSTAVAVLRNSYLHPRNHIAAYLKENGDEDASNRLLDETADVLREAVAPPFILGPALYNQACVRARQGRVNEALDLLEQMAPMRPDILAGAAADPDLGSLRGEPRFRAMVPP
jgi:hypothetical protein